MDDVLATIDVQRRRFTVDEYYRMASAGILTEKDRVELIAERIVRFARIVGRENVIAGADCGFAASAVRFNDVHPSVVWLKFAALAEGARLATRQLWGRA